MEIPILSISNSEIGRKELPDQFSEPVNSDIIRRAVQVIELNNRQPYGAKSDAGKRHSAKLSRRRRDYRGSYGIGISRVPRKIMSRRGARFNMKGAFAPGTVGGRRAHPPKARLWKQKINRKERRKAIRSALAATMIRQAVEKRGHKLPEKYPFVIENKLEKISRTKQMYEALCNLGFKPELERAGRRGGRGKGVRGRGKRTKSSLLIIVSDQCNAIRASSNISGVEGCTVGRLNARLLAPGGMPGRITLFSEGAIDKLKEKMLFSQKTRRGRTQKTE
ncbi:50S ribosomal protein L4 [Candidatus Woesearchaeota archaeon CG08_land_8_20_14_0_20_47_9]|nr:MAG: 50S ribosomal protein L4 [Candidatus Woesearchaeota archaeon CG1_02_47_18]PIO04170.1 MAG: 50S ribosomal protein L4 [Candidatus Woesearchaeota archaeon CG08_land_8_20_14_0_20_47_9]HII29774.1 50S ribosomal protein L4 [Candidatus Woesearchaeota archaeon]